MWICPRCGEPHQDQFKECWKCVGSEMNEHVTAEPPRLTAPTPERRLRPVGSILLRAGAGFLIGVLLSLSSCDLVNPRALLPGQELSPAAKTVFALVVGLIFGLVVGLFFWVVFPYQRSNDTLDENSEASDESR
jgi:hypothetical protein